MLLFTYGTLLSGESNHNLLERARFVREATTAASYRLYDLGGYPGLVGEGDLSVIGEVYDVDAYGLARLDTLEGHPHYYRRNSIFLRDGTVVEAYLLEPIQAKGRPVIESGSWRAYRSSKRLSLAACAPL